MIDNLTSTQITDERIVGDIDLIQCVRDIMIRSGLKEQVETLFNTDINIHYASDKRPDVQRQALSIFWGLQFMNTEQGGYEERACLNLPFTDEEWLRVFSEKLIPFIIDNKLPKTLYV